MKSITIHNIDDVTTKKLDELSRKNGTSLNKTIKKVINHALGLDSDKAGSTHNDFNEFCGIWNAVDGVNFEKAISDFEKIDAEE
jgi:hypothetical protein